MRVVLLTTVLSLYGLLMYCSSADRPAAEFEPPVRLMAEGVAIRVEEPGYAAPCWADVDHDGRMELLVGQFRQGKIRVYEHERDTEFAAGTWLEADGTVAEVPGVW